MAFIDPYKKQGYSLQEYTKPREAGDEATEDASDAGVLRRSVDTVKGVYESVGIGAWRSLEGILDMVAGVVGGAGGLVSKDFQEGVRDVIEFNVTDYLHSEIFNRAHRMLTGRDYSEYSYLDDDHIVRQVAEGVGGMLPAVAVTVATGGAGAPAAVSQALSTATMATGAAGQATQEAYLDGAGYYQGLAYGGIRGGTEVATEKLFGGLDVGLFGKGFLPSVSKSVADTGVKRFVKGALQEGAEEMTSELLDPLARSVYQGKEAYKKYLDPAFYGDVWDAGVAGTLTGAAFSGTVGRALSGGSLSEDLGAIEEQVTALENKKANLEATGKLTAEAEAAIDESIRENYRLAETILKQAKEGKRRSALERSALGADFEADGSLKAEKSVLLDAFAEGRRLSVSPAEGGQGENTAALDGRYVSHRVTGDRAVKALKNGGARALTRELSEAESKEYAKLRRAMRTLDVASGNKLDYVLAEGMADKNAYFDPDTGVVVIGADTLTADAEGTAIKAWGQALVHEVAHTTEGTWGNEALAAQLSSIMGDDALYGELSRRGYFKGSAEEVKAHLASILAKDEKGTETSSTASGSPSPEGKASEKLTEAEIEDLETFVSEGTAIMAEKILGDGHFIRRLVAEQGSVAEKILLRLTELKESLSRMTSKDAKSLHRAVAKAERLYLKAVEEAGYRFEGGKFVGSEDEEEVKESRKDFGDQPHDSHTIITANMSEPDRALILKNKTITPPTVQVNQTFDVSFEELERNRKSAVEKPLIKKLRELGYLKEYQTDAVDVSFDFTAAGLRKSMNSQVSDYGGSLADLARVVMNMQALLDSAVLIEVHTDKAKGTPRENPRLVQTYVLLSAFSENESIVPIQFEVKQYIDGENRLYLAVAMTKIETGVMGDTANQNGERTRLLPVSDISIPQFIEKINPRDENFFKYIPDEFLSEEQIAAKEKALAKEDRKYGREGKVKESRKAKSQTSGDLDSTEDAPFEKAVRRMEERYTKDELYERAVHDREVLVDALTETVQTEAEYRIVKNYRGKIEELSEAELRIAELRQKTARVNKEIEALKKRKGEVDRDKPAAEVSESDSWVENELNEAKARKQAYMTEMDELGDMIQKEEDKLLSLSAARSLKKVLHEANKRADAMERSADRAREREQETREWARKEVKDARTQRDEKVSEAWDIARERISKERAKREAKVSEAWDIARQRIGEMRVRRDESFKRYKAKQDRLAGESKERGEITVRKRAVLRMLGALNTKLYNPTKTSHVPQELHDLTIKTLAAADPKAFGKNRKNIKEMGELAAAIERLERKAARTGREQETLDKMKSKYEHLEDETLPLKKQAEALLTAFVEYNDKAPEALKYPQGLLNIMEARVKEIEDVSLSKMGLRSLEAVETFVKMLNHQIENSNKLFSEEKEQRVSDMGNEVMKELMGAKTPAVFGTKAGELTAMGKARSFLWKNVKPLTAFEIIGSSKLKGLFLNVMKGEEVWARDIQDARAFILEAKKKYGFDEWDLETRKEFTDAEGKTVKLNLSELMSLYAYSFRDQAVGHLTAGGFVLSSHATDKTGRLKLERSLNDATRYVIGQEEIMDIASLLTKEQQEFVQTLQGYLSDVMGKKGNEVSMKLYGMELFREKFYFPIKSKKEYLEAHTGRTGDPNIKNRGMAKEVVPDAKNPLVLEDFMDICVEHINSMATYHAFVLPVEDLMRVYNYAPSGVKQNENGEWVKDEENDGDFSTIQAAIVEKYGEVATGYIEQVIRDLNGGARRDAAASLLDRGLTAFKRASTLLSLSTIVQQPTSIARAMAYVNVKYFAGDAVLKGTHHEKWLAVMDAAPVAVIKDMGGYDTGIGTRTQDYLKSKEYETLGEKVGGFFKDSDYRAEVFGRGAAFADEVAWISIYEACVREQADKLKVSVDSKPAMMMGAKRFAEVIRRTQVYDSTLTRTEIMRSKDTGAKMVTAFMAEPSTVVNMMIDGIVRASRGDWAFMGKTVGAVTAAIILNSILVSLVYAMRDDDEDQNYGEKYLESLLWELSEGVNPAEYFPYLRDIMSLVKGYDVERSDMTLFAQLIRNVQSITSERKTPYEKVVGVAGAVSSFFGLPVKNVERDARGLLNTVAGAIRKDPEEDIPDAVRQEMNRLVVNGMDVLPRGVGDTVTYEGQSVKLTAKQKAQFRKVYGEANEAVSRMVSMKLYAGADDEAKAKAIKRLYGIYYNRAIEDLLGVDIENKNVLMSRAVDPAQLSIIAAVCAGLGADVGKDGKVITGSKKAKVISYLSALNLKAAQKHLILGYLGYKNTQGEEKVRAYLAGLGLGKGEAEALLEIGGY